MAATTTDSQMRCSTVKGRRTLRWRTRRRGQWRRQRARICHLRQGRRTLQDSELDGEDDDGLSPDGKSSTARMMVTTTDFPITSSTVRTMVKTTGSHMAHTPPMTTTTVALLPKRQRIPRLPRHYQCDSDPYENNNNQQASLAVRTTDSSRWRG
jgi:hypothetical protein